jgi:hypothetical protein
MSDQLGIDDELNLEDFFLSQEFGHPWGGVVVPGPEAILFSTPEVAPSPSVFADPPSAGDTSRHDTSSHRRRSRTLAAVSGAAASLIIALGLLAHTSGPVKPLGTTALGSRTAVPRHAGAGTIPAALPAPSASSAAPPAILTSDDIGAGGAATGTGAAVTHPETGAAGAPSTAVSGTGNTGTGTAGGSPSEPAPSEPSTSPTGGSVVASVVGVVGTAVAAVGTTASTASTAIGSAVTPLAPVTDVVGSLGTSLTQLGDLLAVTP